MNDHNHSLDCHVKVPFTTEELQTLAESRYAGITPHQQLAQILNQNQNRNTATSLSRRLCGKCHKVEHVLLLVFNRKLSLFLRA
jgi:hypothetical protein